MTAAAPAGNRHEEGAAGAAFELDAGWRLHPQVALRPEPFGALLYHFHTRKLSFLKHPDIVTVVRTLDEHPSARAACAAAGVDIDDPATARLYMHALGQLAASRMIDKRGDTADATATDAGRHQETATEQGDRADD